MKLLLATNNKGKLRELQAILADMPLELLTPADLGLTLEVDEDGSTYAENAAKNFAPAPGRIGAYKEPAGPGVRVDSGVGPGGEVSPMYDPMVSKLIVWDVDREAATRRMIRALEEYEIEGLTTLIPFGSTVFR